MSSEAALVTVFHYSWQYLADIRVVVVVVVCVYELF